jgi:hypothetical protein
MNFNLEKALQDPTREIELHPMNYDANGDAHHNDEEEHGTLPDYYTIVVSGSPLSEDTVYFEMDIPKGSGSVVEEILTALYEIN